jgi:hypothetical protein
MNIYEVIYWGSPGKRDKEDTIYLIRADNFSDAIGITQQFAKPKDHGGESSPLPSVIYEIGQDLSVGLETFPRVLRGPYFDKAFNFGWRYWDRRAEDGSETDVWHEKKLTERPPDNDFGCGKA